MGDFPSIVQQPSQIIFLLKIKLCNSIEHCLISEADHLVFLQNILSFVRKFCTSYCSFPGIMCEVTCSVFLLNQKWNSFLLNVLKKFMA